MNKKIKTWIKRYLPAEIAGTISAIFFATSTYALSKNDILAAFAGTWGENLGFYGIMIIRDLKSSRKNHKEAKKHYNLYSLLIDIRSIILEFGPSEILDSFLIRPFMMYIFPIILGNRPLGVFTGKLAADVIFYIPVIISYELQQMHKNRKKS